MSTDDRSLGRREDRADPRGRGQEGLSGTLTALVDRLRTHMLTWPGRYVRMRASRYERE
jgi:hypothetical protein